MDDRNSLSPEWLYTLATILSEGSITAAAKCLGLTQQAVSAQMRKLEENLGTAVLQRSQNRISLTQDGEALLIFANEISSIEEKLRRHFSARRLTGRVRAGFVNGFASVGLMSVLRGLRIVQPDIEIMVRTESTDRLMAQFDAGQLDLILGVQREGEMKGEALWRDKLTWVGDVSALYDADTPVPLVMFPGPNVNRSIILAGLKQAGRRWTIHFESGDLTSLHVAIRAGWGVSAFSDRLCNRANLPIPVEGENPLPDLDCVEVFLRIDPKATPEVRTCGELVRAMTRDMLSDPLAGTAV